MKKRYLEAGKIVGTHGVHGQLKLECWCDGPGFLLGFKTFYFNGAPVEVEHSSVHKNLLLLKLRGVDDVERAMALKGATLTIDREQANLPEGRYFIADLIGLPVYNEDGGEIGRLEEVLNAPAGDVYVVAGEKKYMIPAVPAFIKSIDPESGIRVALIPGLEV